MTLRVKVPRRHATDDQWKQCDKRVPQLRLGNRGGDQHSVILRGYIKVTTEEGQRLIQEVRDIQIFLETLDRDPAMQHVGCLGDVASWACVEINPMKKIVPRT